MQSIISLYPLAKLPHGGLTDNEKTLVQCAYLWVNTFSTEETPPSATASYSELWHMLQHLRQVQMVIRNDGMHMKTFVENHRSRYAAAAGPLPHSFDDILYQDFTACGLPSAAWR